MAVILNMVGFDASVPINCQVCIIFPGFSYARADPNYLGKDRGYVCSREPSLVDEERCLRTCR
jgi:hypothetical protein